MRRLPARFEIRRLLAVVALLSIAACVPGGGSVDAVLSDYMEAVQSRNLDRLYCLSAGAAAEGEDGADPGVRRDNFDRWADAMYESYLEGRDLGRVELAGEGILTVKSFALGRGTFYSVAGTGTPSEGVLLVDTSVRFGYGQLDLSRLSPGTTFYLNGAPPGRILPIRVPRGSREIDVEVLAGVTLRWTLVDAPSQGGCPAGWTVASVEAVDGSASTTSISWVF